MKIRKEFKIGITILVAAILLFWGINFLKGSTMFSSEYILHAHYNNVSGLLQTNPVMLNGYKIGQVEKIQFSPDNDGTLLVSLKINNSFPIPDNSIAKIINTSITGSKGIEIVLGNSLEALKHDDAIQSGVDISVIDSVVEELMPLKDQLSYLMESFSETTKSINAILGEETQQNLIDGIESLSIIMETVADQRGNINTIMNNARMLTANLEQDRQQLSKILGDVSVVTEDLTKMNLSATINNLDKTIASVDSLVSLIQTGDGTVGKLLTDGALYDELTQTSKQLKLLLEDVQANPKKYVKFSLF
ncbi:MAG: MlaD family protein [Bacteroidales bacterium]|jgi:phospholipid/cholesterol/gamma-HCH transport system substrate-binding protein|nr:MlaD family protein [Bacteroidales bacterium]